VLWLFSAPSADVQVIVNAGAKRFLERSFGLSDEGYDTRNADDAAGDETVVGLEGACVAVLKHRLV
jgi:hypothetical protein